MSGKRSGSIGQKRENQKNTPVLKYLMTTSALRKISEEEYLRTEETSLVKREYVDGFVYPLHAQAGAVSKHGLISSNLVAALHRPARRSGCRVYASDMRVRYSETDLRYYYPDVVLTCEDMPDAARYAEAPCLIVEVLSETTQDTDRREKRLAYTQLPTLQGYLLVDTEVRAVRLYTRTESGWDETYLEDEGEMDLPCVGVKLTLDEVYEGTRV